MSLRTRLFNTTAELHVSNAHFGYEIKRRAPWMFLSFLAGIVMVFIGRNFEQALSRKVELVFFIPMIVYMSDSIGTETLALFVRELALRRVSLHKLFLREACVGLSIGLITGVPMGLVSYLWIQDFNFSLVVTITMVINGLVAVLLGILTPFIFRKFRKDPALGTEEITTAISDNLSMLVYLAIATFILFSA